MDGMRDELGGKTRKTCGLTVYAAFVIKKKEKRRYEEDAIACWLRLEADTNEGTTKQRRASRVACGVENT